MHTISLSTITELATKVGFDACGVCQAEALIAEKKVLASWLEQGMHGEMTYMERNIEKRVNPTLLVSGVKSVVTVLLNYYPGNPTIATQPPKISRYALSTDYHTVIKQKLWTMLDLLRKQYGTINGRAFVDSAPVLERTWAQRAGLGWIGKNGLLINPTLGTYTFIGELIVDADIEPSTTPTPNRCGTCTRCIDACPTGAIVEPGVVDARKCISYLTIEKKSSLTEQEKQSLNGWCFGCDTCQEVCPWNGKLATKKMDGYTDIDPRTLINLNEADYKRMFASTPIIRANYNHFMHNVRQSSNF